MLFGGRNLETFYKAKALRFDVSYYTDFNKQELVNDGFLLSAIEVPTIRQITVPMLIRAESKQALKSTVQELTDWLLETGLSTLYEKQDAPRFYWARVTHIDNPEFSGLTATMEVIFTCDDCRPYDSATNQAIGKSYANVDGTYQENYFSNFTFGGKHCLNNMSCVFVIDNFIMIPELKRNVYQIAGQSGTIRYDAGSPIMGERSLTGWLYIVNSSHMYTTPSIYRNQKPLTKMVTMSYAHRITDWLINSMRADFIFDSDITRKYQAEVANKGELDYSNWANGRLKVEFTLQPYSESVDRDYATMYGSATHDESWQGNNYIIDFTPDPWTSPGVASAKSIGFPTPLLINLQNVYSPTDVANDMVGELGKLEISYFDSLNREQTMVLQGAPLLPHAYVENGNTITHTLVIDGNGSTITRNKYSAASGQASVLVDSEDITDCIVSGDFPVLYPGGNKTVYFHFRDVNNINPSSEQYPNCGMSYYGTLFFNARWI